ncbi:UDP-glucuronosyltransferase 2B2-like [Bombyx mandarina]|uniref:UDP-glucuronosyltransferase n=1 Tax=Bombyx mandarina TaxID=7092 RepID=A0A6J2J7F8_BOMMA|nr:UDP-glucuronosyltransferase 2B2-like [Bombyx mandarina]
MNFQTIHLLVLSALACDAYKILLVFPYVSKSHAILGEGYVRNLLKAGHELTYITPYPKDPAPNLRVIQIAQHALEEKMNSTFTIEKLMHKTHAGMEMFKLVKSFINTANDTVSNTEVQQLMLDPQTHFDVVIAEWMVTEIFSGFGKIFNCPFIWSSSMEAHSLILRLIDEIPHPAYSSNTLGLFEPPYNFFQRAINTLMEIGLKVAKWFSISIEEHIYKEGFAAAFKARGLVQPSLEELRYSAALVLGNSHVSSGAPLTLPQNYKAIGGYHIDEQSKPLPKEFKNILDNSKHGVIYFSLGSVVSSKSMPAAIKTGLFEMFRSLKYTVIWKFEDDFQNIPDNVHVVKWAPQQSILAHPNCILFITHGGLLSTTETLHYGVPIIGIPIFGDQAMNVKKAVHKGIGLEVKFGSDTPKNLKAAINEVLSNQKYRDRVKELSLVYHDRPVTPAAELVHWVEHVVKTKGALHLRSQGLHVPLYQKLLLDIIFVSLLLFLGFVFFVKFMVTRYLKKKIDIRKKTL